MRIRKKSVALLLALVMIASTLPNAIILNAAKNDDLCDLSYQVATEGMVLLKNDDDVLPLEDNAATTISIFGRTQIDMVVGGSGSSNASYAGASISILDAFKDSQITVDEELATIYEEWCEDNPAPPLESGSTGNRGATKNFPEMELETEDVEAAALVSDTAVVIIGRMSGEGYQGTAKGDLDPVSGEYYLSDKEIAMLDAVDEADFDHVVVVLNTCSIIDMNWIDEYGIDAVLLAWAPGGALGGQPIVDLLTGKVNPSAKLTDTIAKAYEDYPSSETFGDGSPIYTEDIYVGYRYFETFAPDRVLYPFGFGLSYTEFDISLEDFEADEDTITLEVEVKNTGAAAGKEVVQVYFSAPQGSLGKPAKELAAYAKTDSLSPGDSQVLTLSFNTDDMSSYDDKKLYAYILEAGDYDIYFGNSVKSLELAGTYNLVDDIITERLSQQLAVEESSKFNRLTWNGTSGGTETVPTRNVPLDGIVYDEVEDITFTDDLGYDLIDVYYGNVTMDEFVAQMTVDELIKLTRGLGMAGMGLDPDCTPGAAGGFGKLPKYGIPAATVADGPCGLRLNPTTPTTPVPIPTALACTWNLKLIEDFGVEIAKELALNNVDVWLAPGLNIHRHPCGGRNMEYYSEDPLITGKTAAAITTGVQSQGIGVTLKHFAANNQEWMRNGGSATPMSARESSILSERALREIYLKGFEITVKEADPWFIMTAYNKINGTYTASSYELNTNILRKEWGFEGTVMTDWFASVDNKDASMIRAQNDMYQPAGPYLGTGTLKADLASETITVAEIQRSVKNIMRSMMKTLAFSKVVESEAPGIEIIEVRGGLISGVDSDVEGITIYKGVPYAKPPIGNLRWKEPEDLPANSWEGVRACDEWPDQAIQDIVGNNPPGSFYGDEYYYEGAVRPPISEDCLYVNVYAPANSAGKKLPVMVWFHGGGSVTGYASECAFDGSKLAEKGAIVVAVQYRLGLLGHMALPELSAEKEAAYGKYASGNYTFHDQVQSLKWVKENIAAFGGDPDNVTIFGQSAGGKSMMAMLSSPLSKGLFNRVIIQSMLSGYIQSDKGFTTYSRIKLGICKRYHKWIY